jgi:hypothetical protein
VATATRLHGCAAAIAEALEDVINQELIWEQPQEFLTERASLA